MVVVNGPVTDNLGINGGANAYGQGLKPNATIGRALTFVYMNVAGAIPGPTDKATHGGPHKFGLCVTENESENPWEPLHVERGFDTDDSAVTVLTTEAPHNVNDHVADSAVAVFTTAAGSISVLGANTTYLSERAEPCLVLSPKHALTVAHDGYSKSDVKRFIYDHARIPTRNSVSRGCSTPTTEVARGTSRCPNSPMPPLCLSVARRRPHRSCRRGSGSTLSVSVVVRRQQVRNALGSVDRQYAPC